MLGEEGVKKRDAYQRRPPERGEVDLKGPNIVGRSEVKAPSTEVQEGSCIEITGQSEQWMSQPPYFPQPYKVLRSCFQVNHATLPITLRGA